MPKAALYKLAWSAAAQQYTLLVGGSGSALPLPADGSDWITWLAEVSSFAFHGQAGSFTARQETVQRGERYWYAYRRSLHKLCKKYLGKTADLTLARLEQVARQLQPALPRREPSGSHPSVQPAPRTTSGSLPSDPFLPLLSTKLQAPRPPTRLVPRARLLERLQQGLEQTLILVCAPAGFGKTTLLAQWLAESELPVAWLSLDAEDNDPARLLRSILAALQTCDPALFASGLPLLASPRGLSLPAVLALLINDIANRESGDLVLVLDDLHVLTSEPIHQVLDALVDHCPPNLHLVLATRADPPLALPRLRARGQLCEVRAADLQFTADEARAFLQTALGRDPEAATLSAILTRTEGWAAGLQLTALSLQGGQSEAEVQRLLSGSPGAERHLAEYLVAEVLAQQPQEVQAFLLATALLDPLSASLCAALTGGSRAESAELLDRLERSNLFLTPLDERREWYRYHPLWAAVLRVRLEQVQGTAEVAALWARASRWYEQHDLPAEAIEAALSAGEYERAAQLIEQQFILLLVRGHHTWVSRWIERLPTEQWMTRPVLCLTYAWALFLGGRLSAYRAPLQESERLFARDANAIGLGLAASLRALAAVLRSDGQEALAAGRRALALLPPAYLPARSISLSAVGTGSWLLGEVAEARHALTEAHTLHVQAGDVTEVLLARLILGQVLGAQGQLREAAATYQQVIEEAAERRPYAIEAHIYLAAVLYEWNACEEAEAHLARALEEAGESADHALLAQGLLAQAYLTQARLKQARGNHAGAEAFFAQAVWEAEQRHHSRLLVRAEAVQVRWRLAQGDLEAGRRWRNARTGTLEATPSYPGETDALTLARVLLAEGQTAEALLLLEGYLTLARRQGRVGSEVRLLLLCALALARRGRRETALERLQEALTLAEPAGYIRLFLDEGPKLAPLLRLVLARWQGQPGAQYAQHLLTLLEAEYPPVVGAVLDDPQADHLPPELRQFSARELAVLRLLAEGLTLPQMAERLIVSPNTIKTQLTSLYRKLAAQNRVTALSAAQRLRLL